jgi:hypothetical protein
MRCATIVLVSSVMKRLCAEDRRCCHRRSGIAACEVAELAGTLLSELPEPQRRRWVGLALNAFGGAVGMP